eukprot:scaffold110811_cov32-Tisochrysis_lutea.AAC.2
MSSEEGGEEKVVAAAVVRSPHGENGASPDTPYLEVGGQLIAREVCNAAVTNREKINRNTACVYATRSPTRTSIVIISVRPGEQQCQQPTSIIPATPTT